MKKPSLWLKLLPLAFLLVQASCVKRTTVLPPSQRLLPAKDATEPDLLQALEQKSRQIKTLKATVALDLTRGGAKSGVLDEYRQTKGYVIVDRPCHIRVQIQLPIVLSTVATMVSDCKEYRLWIPPKNQFAIENVDAPIDASNSLTNLRPQVFLDGLFVDITPFLDRQTMKSLFNEEVEGVHSYYVFSFFEENPEPQLVEKLWIDRSDLEVARKQMFGKNGRLETDVDYTNYHDEGGVSFPEVITIHRPLEDLTVKMTFQQTAMNDELDAKSFNLPRPEGSQLVQLTK